MMNQNLKIIECPRDAMQGWEHFIPTEKKIKYINLLLEAGFDTIDFGGFVSPKAIPQMRDTAEVLASLNLNSQSKLLAIVANTRGAQDSIQFEEIDYLGFPFSVSEEFQQRNTNSSIEESLVRVEEIQNLCVANNKKLVVYLSMGFGNPYGEAWHPEIVAKWSERLSKDLGISILALSDTIGCADEESITSLFSQLIPELPKVEFGAHLHTLPEKAKHVIQVSYEAGCRRFDGAIKGFGGCPMATNKLTGNMPTEKMLEWFTENNINHGVDIKRIDQAEAMAAQIFV